MTLRRSTQAIMRYGAAGAAPTHIRNRWGGHVVDRFVMMESLYRYIHVYIHSASKRLRQLYFRDNFVKSMPVFTARHNARIASTVLTTAIPSVCPSVRPSVTRRYCVKTTAHSMVQAVCTADSKMCLVLQKPKNIPQGRPLPREILAQSDLPLLIAANLDTFCLVAPQR